MHFHFPPVLRHFNENKQENLFNWALSVIYSVHMYLPTYRQWLKVNIISPTKIFIEKITVKQKARKLSANVSLNPLAYLVRVVNFSKNSDTQSITSFKQIGTLKCEHFHYFSIICRINY